MDEKIETFEAWAIVEVFGHVRLAGRVTEQEIAGKGFIRVDVPETSGDGSEPTPGFTRFYGPDAIYSITPTDEATARLAVMSLRPSAITVYIPSRLLAASSDAPAGEDDWGGPYTDPIYEDEDDEPEYDDEDGADEDDGLMVVDERVDAARARANAIRWAQAILRHETFLVLDVETTGLDEEARIVEIAVVNQDGEACMNTRLNPDIHIPAEASAIHGITDLDVAHSPHFGGLWGDLRGLLSNQVVVAYNAAFDQRMIQQEVLLCDNGVMPSANWQCAMLAYAMFAGEWNARQGDWRWYKLIQACRQMSIPMGPAHLHSALDDCRLTLALVRAMAGKDNDDAG